VQTITVYTPAQIRAAYRLPALPAGVPLQALSAAEAAALGAGQTIYIIDAYSSPNVARDLAQFDASFDLPGCTSVGLPFDMPLPLAPAGRTCSLAIAHVGADGGLSDAAPAYDPSWATEISLDVEWAHATAPLARVVLVEAQSSLLTDLAAAVRLANAMGPGVVTMSFGAPEGDFVIALAGSFQGASMSYVASTGDAGAGVNWPAVQPNVLAVGGTSLRLGASGARIEDAWSGTGGGISRFIVEPLYQQTFAIPGDTTDMLVGRGGPMGAPLQAFSNVTDGGPFGGVGLMRSVSDVAFNADPGSGQYMVVTAPNAVSPNWYSGGGTSMGAPQWAGLVAIANAQRALEGRAPLGVVADALYRQVGAVPGLYAAAFLDITRGRDGDCSICTAAPGYDGPTGLGTPNADRLLPLLVAD
jgi:subtilase family serine protease